jgi:hypothetical protein
VRFWELVPRLSHQPSIREFKYRTTVRLPLAWKVSSHRGTDTANAPTVCVQLLEPRVQGYFGCPSAPGVRPKSAQDLFSDAWAT